MISTLATIRVHVNNLGELLNRVLEIFIALAFSNAGLSVVTYGPASRLKFYFRKLVSTHFIFLNTNAASSLQSFFIDWLVSKKNRYCVDG